MSETALTDDGEFVKMVRGQTEFSDGSEGRLYEVIDNEEEFASVTTHLSRMDSPKKDSRLSGWVRRNSWLVSADWMDVGEVETEFVFSAEEGRELLVEGEVDAVWLDGELWTTKAEYWSAYTRFRGTVAHCLLIEDLSGEDIWGAEEDAAVFGLMQMDSVEAFDGERSEECEEIGGWLCGKGGAKEQCKWIVEEAKGRFEGIREVLFAEQYLCHRELGFAGQVDLIYLNEEGEIVIADLKTGLSLYYQYRFQLAAYFDALPWSVVRELVEASYVEECSGVRLRSVRANFEKKESEVESHEDWREDLFLLVDRFEELVEENNEVMF